MKKLDMMYSGKAKMVYRTEAEDLCIIEYRDDATAFNGGKKGSFENKGVVNNRMANIMFRQLEEQGVRTHLVKELSDRETLVKKAVIIPLEVIVRNVAAGSFSKRYGVEEGLELKTDVIEFSYKNDALNDPLINDYHAIALGIATRSQIDEITRTAFQVNTILKGLFLKIGLRLIDFKLEFGVDGAGNIILADEISPDTCRLWQVGTNEKMDKDRFRRDLGGFSEAYFDVFDRVQKAYGTSR